MIDGTNRSFRNNVKFKFSLQAIKKLTNPKGKNTEYLSYMSSLPPPILAKTAKEINEISKYFKKILLITKKNYMLKYQLTCLTLLI